MIETSTRWESPASVFGPFQTHIDGWDELRKNIDELACRYRSHELVWRGVQGADWPLFSSLHRHVSAALGRQPSEDDLVRAEKKLLSIARKDWRFDQLSALEIFARLQHFGGPTRLLDVTGNPLIAAWFCVESDVSGDDQASRLFAFATGNRPVQLDGKKWGTRHPWWHSLQTDTERIALDWGTGHYVRLWRPPIYDNRMSAQNAAFIIDGAPVSDNKNGLSQVSPSDHSAWSLDAIRRTSSVNVKLSPLLRSHLTPSSTPVFTFLIEASAKREIREQLERRYGYRASTIYPDMSGLSSFLCKQPNMLIEN